MTNIIKKFCSSCGDEKPLSKYYKRSGLSEHTVAGHYISECKACMKERSRTQKRLHPLVPRADTEQYAIDYLHQKRIPALPGKALSYAHVDVVAFWIVRIEIKYSKLHRQAGTKYYAFNSSEKQRQNGYLADLVMLICERPTGRTFHLFNANDNVFVNPETETIKTAVSYYVGSHKPRSMWTPQDHYLSEGKMQDAQDNLVLIYDALGRLASELPEKAQALMDKESESE